MKISQCQEALKKSNISVEIPGFTKAETAEAFCTVCRYDKSFDGNITKSLIQRTLTTAFPSVSKSVLGGIQHVVSVDNGAYYAELWYKGGSWYAVTGAELKKSTSKVEYYEIQGITKGMSLPDATIRFAEAIFGPSSVVKAAPCNCK